VNVSSPAYYERRSDNTGQNYRSSSPPKTHSKVTDKSSTNANIRHPVRPDLSRAHVASDGAIEVGTPLSTLSSPDPSSMDRHVKNILMGNVGSQPLLLAEAEGDESDQFVSVNRKGAGVGTSGKVKNNSQPPADRQPQYARGGDGGQLAGAQSSATNNPKSPPVTTSFSSPRKGSSGIGGANTTPIPTRQGQGSRALENDPETPDLVMQEGSRQPLTVLDDGEYSSASQSRYKERRRAAPSRSRLATPKYTPHRVARNMTHFHLDEKNEHEDGGETVGNLQETPSTTNVSNERHIGRTPIGMECKDGCAQKEGEAEGGG
jgi:hypothetical protein